MRVEHQRSGRIALMARSIDFLGTDRRHCSKVLHYDYCCYCDHDDHADDDADGADADYGKNVKQLPC